jgi:hypothetical protein
MEGRKEAGREAGRGCGREGVGHKEREAGRRGCRQGQRNVIPYDLDQTGYDALL